MFFNYCRRCCCRQNGNQEKDCPKYDYDKCDKHDDKCDKYDDRHNKCDWEKKEKCCCHINYEKCSCWDNIKRENQPYNYVNQNNQFEDQNNRFEGQNYFGEYNNLGYFNHQIDCGCDNDNNKPYQKEDNNCRHDFDKNCYTPDWNNDKNCKCEKDKFDKCDKHENKCCKPVKYICIPFDKY